MTNLPAIPNPFEQLNERLAAIESKLDHIKVDPKEPEHMTMDEACEFTNLSKHTIYKRTSTNQMPFSKFGRKIIFKRSELVKYMNGEWKPTTIPQRGVVIER
jgi:excisionase family DNA binding protein